MQHLKLGNWNSGFVKLGVRWAEPDIKWKSIWNQSRKTPNFLKKKFRFGRFRIREKMWWTCYRTMMVMVSLTLKMRTIPTLTTKMTNCKVFPFPPEIIQFQMIHLPNCSQSTTILPFRNLLKYCSDKKIKTKMSPFSLFPSIFWINMKENNDWKVIQCMIKKALNILS